MSAGPDGVAELDERAWDAWNEAIEQIGRALDLWGDAADEATRTGATSRAPSTSDLADLIVMHAGRRFTVDHVTLGGRP